jgi:hypothetical protein
MVSTTYAWFTLSTAPEVTGITTQVGANGNLEIALLTTATYSDTSSISSAVGDSSAATSGSVTKANTTWGNLLDLSDSSYGLTNISLLPSELNADVVSGNVVVGSPLKTAVYGVDGRVSETTGNTTTAINNKESNVFQAADSTQYGVRAIGTSSNLSAQEIGYRNAKSSFASYKSLALNTAQSALNSNLSGLVALASAKDDTTISAAQATYAYNIAVALQNSLNYVEKAYRQAAIAYVSTKDYSETVYSAAVSVINSESLTDLAKSDYLAGSELSSELSNLATAESQAKSAVTALSTYTTNGGSGADLKAAAKPLLNSDCYERPTETTVIIQNKEDVGASKSCVLGDVAEYAGAYSFTLADLGGVTVSPMSSTPKLVALSETVSRLNSSVVTNGSSNKALSDTYGYVLDFAVRTNAASSNLLLQTDAAQRVYNDSNSTATQGSGSTLKLSYTAGLTATQATKLLGAIRVVFMNPENGEIYGTAVASNIDAGSYEATAKLYLKSSVNKTIYVLGKDAYTAADSNNSAYVLNTAKYEAATEKSEFGYENYAEALSAADYNKLADKTTSYAGSYADKGIITALEQNTVKKLSVLVYMDGNEVDNTAVINAASSGALTMNLQFSSSAELTPMSNTALKQTANLTGIATGATLTGNSTIDVYTTAGITLTPSLSGVEDTSGETITSITWSSSDTSIATVTGTALNATVKPVAVGQVNIVAVITTDKGNVYVATKTINVLNSAQSVYFTNDGQEISALTLNQNGTTSATLGYAVNPDKTTSTIYGQKWEIISGSDVISFDSATNTDTTSGAVLDNSVTIKPVNTSITGTAQVKLTIATQQKLKTGTTDTYEPDFTTGTHTQTLNIKVSNKAESVNVTKEADTAAVSTVKLAGDSTSSIVLSLPESSVDSITKILAVSSDPSIATVTVDNETNKLTIKGNQTYAKSATIVAVVYTENGAVLTKTIEASVVMPTLTLNNPSSTEGTASLSVSSTEGTISSVAWSSSNTDIATVAEGTPTTGATLTGKSAGAVTITATVTYEGGGKAIVSGTVNVPAAADD